jgi:predicted TIM-barrel fold metal-dependent hydrolase
MAALRPYLDEFWRDSIEDRGIDSLDSISYPPKAPISARSDLRDASGRAATTLAALQAQVFGRWGAAHAICNCLYGVQLVFNEDMGHAFARAVNDWIAKEWLDRDARLRASIVVPLQNVEYAVDEIERCAKDRRFVQVLVLAMGETPLGRRHFWPVYAAAERHGLALGIHAGSAYRHPVTSLGWPTYYIEDYLSQS